MYRKKRKAEKKKGEKEASLRAEMVDLRKLFLYDLSVHGAKKKKGRGVNWREKNCHIGRKFCLGPTRCGL